MELTRRNLLVYGLILGVWLLVVGWQVEEHIRVREAAKADELELTREEWYRLLLAARGEPLP